MSVNVTNDLKRGWFVEMLTCVAVLVAIRFGMPALTEAFAPKPLIQATDGSDYFDQKMLEEAKKLFGSPIADTHPAKIGAWK